MKYLHCQKDYTQTGRKKSSKYIRGHDKLPKVVAWDRRLSSDARYIYWLLKTYDRPGKGECWPSQERLAELAGWETRHGKPNRRRVQKALDELEAANLITRKRGGQRRTNTYRLLPVPDELPEWVLGLTDMPAKGRKAKRRPASSLRASDAPASDAENPCVFEGDLGNGGQQENGLQNELSPQNPTRFCARRIYSSLREGGYSSSKEDKKAVESNGNGDFAQKAVQDLEEFEDLQKNLRRQRENAEEFDKNALATSSGAREAQEDVDRECALRPMLGRQLSGGRWRCENCGWVGPFSELLPRRFEGDREVTYLCPSCRKGVAISTSPVLAILRGQVLWPPVTPA